MEILIESTKEFEQDLEAFTKPEQSDLIKEMNQYFQGFLHQQEFLFQNGCLQQLKKIQLNNNYDSSLYSLSINSEIRVILTIDEDPIFDRIIITLFRLVESAKASEAYSDVAKSLYKNLILDSQEVEYQPI